MADYLNVVFDEKVRPKTSYPGKLCSYLFSRYGLRPGQKFLEAGCGRGDFLKCFKDLGVDAYGVDLSKEAPGFNPDIPVKVCNIEEQGIDFPDTFFDVVYSKSLIEHFYNPEVFMKEACRVLKPGGMFLTLTPDWEARHETFYDDHTHRTPFTSVALEHIYKMFDFQKVSVTKIRQLPIVWKYPVLNIVSALVAPFVPPRTDIKFFRWSRELMLAGVGFKSAKL